MPLSKAKNKDRMKKLRHTYVQPKPVKAVQPSSNLTDTYSAPMPAWMLPGAKVTQVKPAKPAWM